jgi:threonine dehydrogenase-like Zn-dependent dehydrogenase
MSSLLPSHHRALVLSSLDAGFQLKTLPTPQPTLGSAIVNVLSVTILSYMRDIYSNNPDRNYSFPKPLVGGMSAIGRIAALGPDSVSLQPSQLVYIDFVIRGRDDPSILFLSAINEGFSSGSKKLMRDVWRDGTFAEYAKVPLENCIPLNEARL